MSEPPAPALPHSATLASRSELLHRGRRFEVLSCVWNGQSAVVKRLREDRPIHERAAARLRAEAQLLERCEHAAICRVLDVNDRSARPELVLENGGQSLAALRASDPSWQPTVHQVAAIGRHLAGALAYLHELGFVHADVKPHNITIDPRGDVRLVDFDLARRPGPLRRRIGTSGFRAPEVEDGECVLPASDIWSLGALLRWLAAEPPAALLHVLAHAQLADTRARPTAAELAAALCAGEGWDPLCQASQPAGGRP